MFIDNRHIIINHWNNILCLFQICSLACRLIPLFSFLWGEGTVVYIWKYKLVDVVWQTPNFKS